MAVSLLIRCERDGCGTKSPSPESPGGSQLCSAVYLLHLRRQCAVVSSEPRGPPHPPVLHYFRDKERWKIKCHDSPCRTPQFTAHFLFADYRLRHLLLCCVAQCSPGTCSLYTNPPWAQPLLQPQSHREATTGHLQCLMLLTYISTVLTTDTFWPYRLWTLVFIFPSPHVSPSALETSNWELAE